MDHIPTIDDLLEFKTLRADLDFATLRPKLPLPGNTPISDAIKFCIDNEKLEFGQFVKLLSDRKFKVAEKSPCEYALQSKHFSMITEMIKHGFDINSLEPGVIFEGSLGPVPVIIRAIRYSSEALKFILSLKPNLDIGFEGKTPLMVSLRHRRYKCAELLLNANANIMIETAEGQFAVHFCDLPPKSPESQILKEKILSKYKLTTVGDLITRENHRGMLGRVKLIESLCLDFSEPIDTVILKSVIDGYFDLIKCIVTDFNMIPENKKFAILMECVDSQRSDMLDFFLTKGANVDMCNGDNVSLLIIAACRGNIDIIRLLIDKKANLNILTVKGNTAVTYAIRRCHYNIAELLLDANVNIVNKNNPKRDALYVCKRVQSPLHKKDEREQLLNRLEKMTLALQKSQDSINEPLETIENPQIDEKLQSTAKDGLTNVRRVSHAAHEYAPSDNETAKGGVLQEIVGNLDEQINDHQEPIDKPHDMCINASDDREIIGNPEEQINDPQEPIDKPHDVCINASDDIEIVEQPQKPDDPACICVSSEGNEYVIPEKLVILACWDKQLNIDSSTIRSHFHQIQGLIRYDTPIDGKWHCREYTFPVCSIEIPENYVPKCHVTPSGIMGFDKGVIIRFFQFTYA
jgi:ankyrin repeat protein